MESYLYLNNNTIVNNADYIVANDMWGVNHFKNCIIWGNENGFAGSPYDTITFANCIYDFYGDPDPGFVWPSAGIGIDYEGMAVDWSVTDDSPCVNNGLTDTTGLYLPENDLAGNPRVLHGNIDIGAFEYPWPVHVPECEIKVQVYPNPFTSRLYLSNLDPEYKTIQIYDIEGLMVYYSKIEGDNVYLDLAHLNPGTYFLGIDHVRAMKIMKLE